MTTGKFIVVGENIHCTRIFKTNGPSLKPLPNGDPGITYKVGKETRLLPIPALFRENADWQAGKVKHCAVAVWQGLHGDADGRKAGADYLRSLAARQEAASASYIDVNVDEFSTDPAERARAMQWTVQTVQAAVRIPVSVDSSNTDILRAGLEAADRRRDRPMVNSVSLERPDAVDVAAQFKAVVIASAAGEKGLPSTNDERLRNLETLMPKLKGAGLAPRDIHVDPLVLPISTDGANGKAFLDVVSAVRAKYGPEIHIVAGLSNVSYGMPNRKLINQVFARLAVEAGADGGIVDPFQINGEILAELDPNSEPFRLARALLVGEDEFGMEFIAASRDGRI